MHINLIATGTQMPDWVKLGYEEYAKRLPKEYHFNLIEIPTKKRYKSTNITQLIEQESQQLLAAVPQNGYIIALDRMGKTFDSQILAKKLKIWQEESLCVNFLVGGPEGLSIACRQQAHSIWSLSNLTLPHPLVRVIVAEQLFRAYTILIHHPYHR
jgi:23S rRNA (pseudouridine1915-N3)-methyltransferase